MKKIFYISVFILIFSSSFLSSQSGMRFEELTKRIEQYFAEPLIQDVKEQLPQGTDYRIWGWDVGDFSGDSYNDLALSVKLSGDKKKTNYVFLFVDLDGYLTKISELPFDYVEMPSEIGVVIRYGICNITKKLEKFNWIIRGFKFDNGVLIQQDNFETEKIGKYTPGSLIPIVGDEMLKKIDVGLIVSWNIGKYLAEKIKKINKQNSKNQSH